MLDADRRLRILAARQEWVITADQAYAAGLSADDIHVRCRRGEWRSLFHGVYVVDADIASGSALPRATVIRAGVLAAGPGATAFRESAGELLRLPCLPSRAVVHAAVAGDEMRRRQSGLRLHQVPVPSDQRRLVHGIACTTTVRTVADLLLTLDRMDAVCLLDAVLHDGRLTEADFAACLTIMDRRPGCVQGRRRLAECDRLAASPGETRVRLICTDAGVPPDALQHPVRDRHGTLLGLADLAWRSRRLAAEADGAGPHGQPYALFRDRYRQNDFTLAGWRTIRFTWADTFRPGYVIATVRAALAGRDRS
jgi:hypothetical protein